MVQEHRKRVSSLSWRKTIPLFFLITRSIFPATSFLFVPVSRKTFVPRSIPTNAFPSLYDDANNATVSANFQEGTIGSLSTSVTTSYSGKETQTTRKTIIPKEYSLRHALNVETDIIARRNQQRVVGHRGALYEALENTREAFQKCVEIGCDAVELDVFAIRDEQSDQPVVIVFHGGGSDQNPGDLSDYCLDQDGISILDLSYQQSQNIKFNPNHSEFGCSRNMIENARIPTLEEVLMDLKGTGVKVKIELKGPGTVEPTLLLVERLGMIDQCAYSCFDHEKLKYVRQLRPNRTMYPTGALFDKDIPENFLDIAKACGATEVHLKYDTCTVDRVNAIRQAGMISMAWFRGPVGMASDVQDRYWDMGNEDEACYEAVLDTGVDELCVNRPNVLKAILRQPSYK